MNKKKEVIKSIIPTNINNIKSQGKGSAFINIALSKYWGKRDSILNLPVTSSLSVTLPFKTKTEISIIKSDKDKIFLNNSEINGNNDFKLRISSFLDLFRYKKEMSFLVKTSNDIPTAAGLASSASGFAACVLALNDLFNWNLNLNKLSILARIGSGSASRSIFNGFVEWHAGILENGMDCYSEPLNIIWNDLRIGLLIIESKKKKISSREGMIRTKETSDLYQIWAKKNIKDLTHIKNSITKQDIHLLGTHAESNALTMHATMLGASPPILYWQPKTIELIKKVWSLRKQGLHVYFTMDAGPNIKLLFNKKDKKTISSEFPDAKIVKVQY